MEQQKGSFVPTGRFISAWDAILGFASLQYRVLKGRLMLENAGFMRGACNTEDSKMHEVSRQDTTHKLMIPGFTLGWYEPSRWDEERRPPFRQGNRSSGMRARLESRLQ